MTNEQDDQNITASYWRQMFLEEQERRQLSEEKRLKLTFVVLLTWSTIAFAVLLFLIGKVING